MRLSTIPCAVAGMLAVLGTAAAASADFTEQFETLPTPTLGTPPGTALALPSGDWFFVNNSDPLGSTGLSRLPSAAGGTTPFTVNPGDGDFYASMNFNNTSGVGTIDSFLMSPVLTFNNGDEISFITRAPTDATPTFPDRLIVKLSTAGASTDASDFTMTLLTINPDLNTDAAAYPQTWTLFTATVSGLGGPTEGRFAFNYNVTNSGPSGTNGNLIGIDRVGYAAVPEPAALGLLAAGGLLVLHRRRVA